MWAMSHIDYEVLIEEITYIVLCCHVNKLKPMDSVHLVNGEMKNFFNGFCL